MNASVGQNEITGTTEKATLTLVPVATVNEKTERGKKMKYMKTRTLEKMASVRIIQRKCCLATRGFLRTVCVITP